jgi:hypothetical protein
MGSVQEVEETAGMHVLTSVSVFWVEHWRVNERMHEIAPLDQGSNKR